MKILFSICDLLWQSRWRHQTDFRSTQQCRLIMVSDNQCFPFVKDMLLEEIVSEPLIHSVYYVNHYFHSGFGHSNVARYMMIDDNSIHFWFVLSEISQKSLATCSLLRQSRSHDIYGHQWNDSMTLYLPLTKFCCHRRM